MSLRIKVLALLALSMVSACGFQPVYGTKSKASGASPLNEGVIVQVIGSEESTHMAQQFKHSLEDLISPNGYPTPNPVYRLKVSISIRSIPLGVARDGTASRYNLNIDSNYSIVRIADEKELTSGVVSNVTSYNNPNNQYFSTYVSEQDARKRGIVELAEAYRQRLANYSAKTLVPVTAESQSNFTPFTTTPLLNENNTQNR